MICGWGVGIMSLYAVDGLFHLEASRREGIRRAASQVSVTLSCVTEEPAAVLRFSTRLTWFSSV